MNPATYIQPGDEIAVVYRDLKLGSFCGRVLEIEGAEYGRRTIIIEKENTELQKDGAIGVIESAAVLTVRRGDSWVGLPLPLMIEEAEKKSRRNAQNERKRIEKKAPLFASHIEVRSIEPERWVEAALKEGEDSLERDHRTATGANQLRSEMEALISTEDFSYLCDRRLSYPKAAEYGTNFWRKQLRHFKEHGAIERLVFTAPLTAKLNLNWLHYDARLTWATAPGGPQSVVVLHVGSANVLCKLAGTPYKDFDPREFPENRNVWLKPEDFVENTER
jgi:hypothetical protein